VRFFDNNGFACCYGLLLRSGVIRKEESRTRTADYGMNLAYPLLTTKGNADHAANGKAPTTAAHRQGKLRLRASA
jgi:hypothetical protein